MKSVCIVVAMAMLVAAPLSLWSAEDGAEVYKKKCANCHGANGEGKAAGSMKIPPVWETSIEADKLISYLTKGEEGKKIHGKPVSGLTEEQAQIVIEFSKTLKK
jgi:mono/diheme cytochrome c family protein